VTNHARLASFHSLLSSQGQVALQAAERLQPVESDFLAHFQRLNRHFPEDLARVALEIAILRREAGVKFPFASRMYFTRQALEQASAWEVSCYRARRFQGFNRLVDLGCSIGGDTLALAQFAPVVGIDLDPLRLAMAQANLHALEGLAHCEWLQADLPQPLPLAAGSAAGNQMALFFDPARRTQERRLHSTRQYHPPLATLLQWNILADNTGFPPLGVKISPAVDLDELAGYDAELEFISLKGELKEAVLWFGALKTTACRASLLPGGHTLAATAAELQQLAASPALLSPPRQWIFEPDPAILRAGLVRLLVQQLDAAQLDADIAYLTSHSFPASPFGRAWQVEDWLPFNLKKLRSYLRTRGVGRLVIKKRGSPLEPHVLLKQLRLQGELEKTLFLTHLQGSPIVIIAQPV